MRAFIFSVFSLFCCLVISTNVYAGKDPIGWSIAPSTGFPAQTSVGSSYAVTYTMVNNLPFAVPLTVSGAYTGGKFTMSNGCNTTLAPNATCVVHLGFQPSYAGVSTAVVTLAYHNNRVPLPTLTSTATSNETSQGISGHVTQPLPAVTYVGIQYPVAFTFINNGDTNATTSAVNVSGFTATANNCTPTLNAHQTCTVSGNYTPPSTGLKVLNVTYVYSNGSVSLSTQTTAFNTGNCHQVSVDVQLPLPRSTLTYADHVVKYVFTNNCPANPENLNTVSLTSNGSPQIIRGTDTCSNTVLNPLSSCSVFAAVIPATATAHLTVTASVNYSGLVADATTHTSVAALTNQQSLHTLMFVNQCNQNIWEGFQNVSTPDPTPTPTWQGHQLGIQVNGAAPDTLVMQFNAYAGGSIFGRTNCVTTPGAPRYGVCETGNCTSLNNSTGICESSLGKTSPLTIFEENLLNTTASDGVYDVSLINGFNVPGEFRSLAPTQAFSFGQACGRSVGALIQPNGSPLAACSWNFTPPATTGTDCTADTETDNTANYYFVSSTSGESCSSSSSTCPGGQVCGMAWTQSSQGNPLGSPIARQCGTLQGYWTLADWTGYASSGQWGTCNLYSHYGMSKTLDSIKPAGQPTYGYSTMNPNLNPLPAAILADMYSCQPTSQLTCYPSPGTPYVCFNTPPNPQYSLNSGYSHTTNVCGCHDWNNSATTPANAVTAQNSNCVADNSLWEQKVYTRILWLKQACPTAYSFQFDDTSTQLTCNVPNQRTSYQITFCPGGKTGLPA